MVDLLTSYLNLSDQVSALRTALAKLAFAGRPAAQPPFRRSRRGTSSSLIRTTSPPGPVMV
jgi:hypothetical protein